MIVNIVISCLMAAATGIFVWLFFLHMYKKLAYYKETLEEITTNKFSELFLFVDISNYFYYYLTALFFFPIVTGVLAEDILIGVLTFLGVLLSPYIILTVMIKKRLKKFERQLPDALIMIAGSIRSGSSLPIALDNLIRDSEPPLSQEFSLYVRERKLGLDRETAFENLEHRVPVEDLSIALSAIRISTEIGGDLTQTLESLAETLRKKLTMEGKIESLTSQGKLQGLVMSSLPLFLIICLMKLEPDAMGQMFTTKIGWMVFATVLCMQILGFFFIKKITTINV